MPQNNTKVIILEPVKLCRKDRYERLGLSVCRIPVSGEVIAKRGSHEQDPLLHQMNGSQPVTGLHARDSSQDADEELDFDLFRHESDPLIEHPSHRHGCAQQKEEDIFALFDGLQSSHQTSDEIEIPDLEF